MERTGRNIKQLRMTTVILGICKFAVFILIVFPENKSLWLLNKYYLICNGFSSLLLGFKHSCPQIIFLYRVKKKESPAKHSLPLKTCGFFAPYLQHRYYFFFPLPVAPTELPFPTHCQSFTLQWKMCPISQGQVNNDWRAIEVRQTDSIQLVTAGFASVSTCCSSCVVGRLLFLIIYACFLGFLYLLRLQVSAVNVCVKSAVYN